MGRSKYNHLSRIKDVQYANLKSVYPGTIVIFNYKGTKIFDTSPLVLVLWNDYIDSKIHGINLNYLNEFRIKMLFNEIIEKTDSSLIEEDQDDASDYDDTLPYRNLLTYPYTRLKLPTYKEDRGGNPLSKSESIRQMDLLYEKHLKKIVNKHDIYRSYHKQKMRNIKVVTYDIEGLLK